MERKKLNGTPLREDLLVGAEQIAAELGWNARQVYYAVECDTLPVVRRIGKDKLVVSREALRRYFQEAV